MHILQIVVSILLLGADGFVRYVWAMAFQLRGNTRSHNADYQIPVKKLETIHESNGLAGRKIQRC